MLIDCMVYNAVYNSISVISWRPQHLSMLSWSSLNPLPHMPILGSSNSAANKDMMSKLWKNGDTIT